MAEESSPGPGTLSDESLATVRLALQRFADKPDDNDGLRDALRRMSAEAREKGVFPEQLLTTLKDMWHGLPNSRHTVGRDDALMLQRVVTICIKEYFSS
jgi:hypothetical protein